MSTPQNKYRLAFVGPMIGCHPGSALTQGERLADYFAAEGYPVISVSSRKNRYARLLDIMQTLVQQRGRYDIQCQQVYSGPSFVVADVASWIGRRLHKRILMVLRGGRLPEFMTRYPHWTRRVLSRADAIIVPSPFLAHELAEHGFQTHVIPNIIDLTGYPYRHRTKLRPKIFWMRSFSSIYNPHLAIRVIARLRESMPEATLVMAGSDLGLFAEIKNYAQAMNQSDAITFPGYLNIEGKRRYGDAADVYINTNQIDNMPVSVVEACAMGLPVVATNVGGIPYLLTQEQTGLLVPPDDDAAMADAILRLLNDPELAGRLSSNGHVLAEESSWMQVLPRWQTLFASVMKDTQK